MGTVAVLSLLVALGLAVVVVRRDVRPGSDPVPAGTGQDDWSPLHVELERARRYDRGFALVQIVGESVRLDGARLTAGATVASDLRLRRTDTAWGGPDRLQLLVPEATRRQLDGMLRRLRSCLGPTVEVRVACFPDDGLTARALVQAIDPSASAPPAEVAGTVDPPLRHVREAS